MPALPAEALAIPGVEKVIYRELLALDKRRVGGMDE